MLSRMPGILLFAIASLLLQPARGTPGCILRTYDGIQPLSVCVCNSTYCDDIEPLGTIADDEAIIYTSDIHSKRMERNSVKFSSTPGPNVLTFDALKLHQRIMGFGGAFTDAFGINMLTLPKAAQDLLMKQYFGPTGTEYTLGRIPMASNDFGTREYSYVDKAGDFNLSTFALQPEDFNYKLPFIKQAMAMAESTGGLKFFASPWSAPAWMKSNNAMRGGGRLRGFEGGQYYVTWANYFVKFLEAYKRDQGIPIWAITVQNEPTTGANPDYKWQTMYFSPQMERNFIKGQLGPTLRASEVGKDLDIIMLDDMRETLPMWADVILNDEEAASYVSGIGVHWYQDFVFPASVLTTTHNRHPTKYILATEACNGYLGIGEGVSLGDYERGEQYAHSIMEDLNNFVVGWMDWNFAVNPQGGPTFVGNIVDAPIIVDKTKGEFLKQPMYYAMAHFTKFLKPGSERATLTVPETGLPDQVETLAAVMADGRRFVAVMNRNTNKPASMSIADVEKPGRFINIELPARAMMSIIFNQ